MTHTTVTKENTFHPSRDEIVWVHGYDSDGNERYIITSNRMRTIYFLYINEQDIWKKAAKARSPIAFEGRVKNF